MPLFSVVAFDCDGVLFDTTSANRLYYNTILRKMGRPEMSPGQMAFIHMHTVGESLVYLLKDEKALETAHELRKTMPYRPFLEAMEMEPYLLDLLGKIRPSYKTAIATNRTDTMATVLHEHNLGPYFDFVACAHDVKRPKPHPDMLLKVAAHFNTEPARVLYVGDSELDEQAARAAKMPFAAFANPGLKAAFHIQNLGELKPILLGGI